MSDYLANTPDLSIRWCPGCEPDRDPTREILETRWCALHMPNDSGAADDDVRAASVCHGMADGADGGNCVAIQGLIR